MEAIQVAFKMDPKENSNHLDQASI